VTGGHNPAATGIESFLDAVAARTPAPGGGASCAVALGVAAALAAMAARFAGEEDAAARADAVRDRSLALAEEDAAAYGPVLAAPDAETRAAALSAAAEPPLEIAELAAEVGALARGLAERGRPALRGDALAGADLAAGTARAAARLVELNLHDAPDDPRLARARAAAGG
jgi:formiminotetrahydrofolate cyclodeaminase